MKKFNSISEQASAEIFQANDAFFEKLAAAINERVDDMPSFGYIDHPYKVPKGYFAAAAMSTMAAFDQLQVTSTDQAVPDKAKATPFKQVYRNWWRAAAAATLLLGGYFGYQQLETPQLQPAEELANVSADDISAYLAENPVRYSELASDVDVSEAIADDVYNAAVPSLSETEIDQLTEEGIL